MRTRLLRTLLPVTLGALIAGCGSDEVRHFRVAKAAPPPAATAAAPGGVPAPAPLAQGGSRLGWTLPAGWSEEAGSGMRFATLRPAHGDVDVSVTRLQGAAGGLLPNVNRWRGQLGLPPLSDADLATSRTDVPSPLGPVATFDFTHEGKRMLAAMTSVGGDTWFAKASGPEADVAAAQPEFVQLVRSFRRATAE